MEGQIMTWLSMIGSTFYYLLLPINFIFSWLSTILGTTFAPLLYLGNYIISGLLLPLRVLAKFETIFIFLGSAALVGLVTGSILHLTSSVFVSLLSLTPVPEETGRSAASVRAARAQKQGITKRDSLKWKIDPSVEKKYTEWVEKDGGKKREEQGLLAQTIIEEDDDSEDGF